MRTASLVAVAVVLAAAAVPERGHRELAPFNKANVNRAIAECRIPDTQYGNTYFLMGSGLGSIRSLLRPDARDWACLRRKVLLPPHYTTLRM